jgi:small subunit ribosomal protein S1
VNLFLPASQVDIRRPSDIGDYMGRTVECVILKIDETRKNVVVSRRKLIEDVRTEMKKKLLAELEVKQIRKGVVKNIADFGAFVDLGGIDGLLHITDMSWAASITRPRWSRSTTKSKSWFCTSTAKRKRSPSA